ncbi:SGNH/GDSL hydrolase family protein [Pinirhizobacter soli]|uniref:SGNH/GDSL hydrolase family protein n=1 Tax=Pinirhizobacter soli TaxID=2786953 RepID=UPI00202A1978|nr:SGNH/GDSL hydrolase family protein [Pinirhizobacter soli]
MKHIVGFLVALVATTATPIEAGTKSPEAGPASLEVVASPESLAPPFALGADTSTYVRCHYRVNVHANLPETGWTWARTPAGQYFSLKGHWAYPSLEAANLFFTDTSQATMAGQCRDTLRREGKGEFMAATAADTIFSYDYNIWTNDTPQAPPGITRIIVFGDSLSDTLNAWNRSLRLVPHAKSWSAGRFSNGKVWPEITSRLTGLDLMNFAFGAAAADGNVLIPGIVQQVDTWRQLRAKGRNVDDNRNVYAILIGGNDFINYGKQADEVLASVEFAARKLLDDGAEHIVLMNLPDISLAPEVRGSSRETTVRSQVLAFNRGLEMLRERLSGPSRVDIFDTYSHFAAALENPADYGFDNVKDSCLDIPGQGPLVYAGWHAVASACKTADTYLFWDRLHPTRRVHAVLGEAMADFIASRIR